MMKRHLTWVGIIFAVFLAIVAYLWLGHFRKELLSKLSVSPAREESDGGMKTAGQKSTEESRVEESQGAASLIVRTPVPKETALPGGLPSNKPDQLPPSPPLPQVPAETSQVERTEAFQLQKSIDRILLKDEPFEAAGKQWTVGDILAQLHGKRDLEGVLPSIEEREIGPYVRKPIVQGQSSPKKSPVYYGVRIVRPSENLWFIHYGILREYLARRQIIIPLTADQPTPDGRSSGVGRLLKFMEGVVYVYNLDQNHLEKDLNLIHPYSIIVFFKISDLFAALDQLQPDDLKWLSYVKNRLRLDRPEEQRELLDQRAFFE